MTRAEFFGATGVRAALAYVILWAASTSYLAAAGADWTFPIASFLIFGIILSALIWFLTRRMDAPRVPVANPKRQSLAFLSYIAVYAVLLIGLWLGSIKQAIAPGQGQDLAVVGYKLLVHVAIPALIIVLLGGALRPLFDTGIGRRGFLPTLVVLSGLMFALLAVVSPSLSQIGALNISPAAAFLWVVGSWTWMSIEAGLC